MKNFKSLFICVIIFVVNFNSFVLSNPVQMMADFGGCGNETICDILQECRDAPACPDEPDSDLPVCGSNGNIYRSECVMKSETCGQGVFQMILDHCHTTKFCDVKCKTPVSRREYVCGSDMKYYKNECEMKKSNCGKHIYVVPMKRCDGHFQWYGCNRACIAVYDPVCGTDDKTYSNKCTLDTENCRSRGLVTKKYDGRCGGQNFENFKI